MFATRIFIPTLTITLWGYSAFASENQTVLREESGTIPSIYYDLRLTPMGVPSGLPPRWPHAMVTLMYDQDMKEWSADSVQLNAPGAPFNSNPQPLREQRQQMAVTLKQSLWTPFSWDGEFDLEGWRPWRLP